MQYFIKNSIHILFISLFASTFSYGQDIIWEKSYGGKHAELLLDAIPTPDYGFILAGSSLSNKNGNKSDNNKGDFDYWVWKMNDKGELDWQKSFGGSGMDLLQSIKITTDAGFILAGTSSSSKGGERATDKKDACKGNSDFWIIKLDAKGNEIWQKTIGGNGQEKLQSIYQTADGGYIVAGSSSSDASPKDAKGQSDPYGKSEDAKGNLDYWVVKLDKNGTIEWQKTIGGKYYDELKSIVATKDGYLLGGYSNSPESGDKNQNNIGVGDYWIVKIDKTGNILWQKTIGGDQDDNLYTLIPTRDGGFIAGGNSNSGATNSKTTGNTSGTDFWVLKFDANGMVQWQETYNFGKADVLNSILENPDGTLLIGGYAQSEASIASRTSANGAPGGKVAEVSRGKVAEALEATKTTDKEGINDYIALKISATGEKLWSKTVGSKGDEILSKLFETRDGGFLLAGTSNGGNSRDKNSAIGQNDFWVVKMRDTTKPEKPKTSIEALPNPVEDFTNIIVNFDYSEGTASLFDINGRLIEEEKITGNHTIPLRLGNLPMGVYIVNIKTNTNEESIKVIKK